MSSSYHTFHILLISKCHILTTLSTYYLHLNAIFLAQLPHTTYIQEPSFNTFYIPGILENVLTSKCHLLTTLSTYYLHPNVNFLTHISAYYITICHSEGNPYASCNSLFAFNGRSGVLWGFMSKAAFGM